MADLAVVVLTNVEPIYFGVAHELTVVNLLLFRLQQSTHGNAPVDALEFTDMVVLSAVWRFTSVDLYSIVKLVVNLELTVCLYDCRS